MVIPRVTFSGDATTAGPWFGVAKKLARECYADKICSRVYQVGDAVSIHVNNIFPSTDKMDGVSKVRIVAGGKEKSLLSIDSFVGAVHPTYLFNRLSVDPYWKAKEPKNLMVLDRRGKGTPGSYSVGDANWQNAKTAVTWNMNDYEHVYRYSAPIYVKDPGLPNKIYRNGKKSKALPEDRMVVGAAIFSNQIHRYLAVTIDGAGGSWQLMDDGYLRWVNEPINLELYATDKLFLGEPTTGGDWELISDLGTLGAGVRLGTSVFFNQRGTEAVSVTHRIAVGEVSAETNRRLIISVSISEDNVLSASMEVDDPFPDSVHTNEYGGVSGLTEEHIQTWANNTLSACDYWYRPDLEPDEDGNHDRLVCLVYDPGTNYRKEVTSEFFDNRELVEGEGNWTDCYYLNHYSIDVAVSGSIQVYDGETSLLSFPVNYTYAKEVTWDNDRVDPGNSTCERTETESNNRTLIYDCDLRGLIFFNAYLDTDYTITATATDTEPPVPYTKNETGTHVFSVSRYDNTTENMVELYSYEEVIDLDRVAYFGFSEENYGRSEEVLPFPLPYYEPSTISIPYGRGRGNSCGYVFFDWYNYAGHLKCLVRKKGAVAEFPIFMSSVQLQYGHASTYIPPEVLFYLTYLENADPDVITGSDYPYYYLLTVV